MRTRDQRTARRDSLILATGVALFLAGALSFAIYLLPAIAMIVGGGLIIVLGICYKYFGE